MSKRRRRNIYTYHRKHLILLSVLFVVFLFIGLGYSVFTANLNASGNLVVREYLQPTLYNTIKREYIMNDYYAHEYTGLHQDSVSGTGDKKIYYWRAATNNAATTILDKNNVIFGGFCWQTIIHHFNSTCISCSYHSPTMICKFNMIHICYFCSFSIFISICIPVIYLFRSWLCIRILMWPSIFPGICPINCSLL